MPSPFPGMNPYLEHPHVWEDFHQTFLTTARAALIPQVSPTYFVRIQKRVYLHEPTAEERASLHIPDVAVTRRGRKASKGRAAVSTLPAPAQVTLPELVKVRVTYLEVVRLDGERVVTTLELLSRSNKAPGEDRESYLTKRKELLVSGVNFVELDLLRGGSRLPLPGLPACDYYALVFRPSQKPKADAWPIRFRDRLPVIPVPLSPGDPEARLDLKAVIDQAYDGAGYEHHVYSNDPEPPLAPPDAAWAAELVPTARRRPRK